MNAAQPPVHLDCAGPFPQVLAELERLVHQGAPVALTGLDGLDPEQGSHLLTFFLHDTAVRQPIEPFATLLAALLHRRQTGLWELFPGSPQGTFLKALPWEQPQCLACACFPLCQGYGAWAGSCATWRAIVTGLAEAARELGRLRPREGRRSRSRRHHVAT
jgi:hypothetical protein